MPVIGMPFTYYQPLAALSPAASSTVLRQAEVSGQLNFYPVYINQAIANQAAVSIVYVNSKIT